MVAPRYTAQRPPWLPGAPGANSATPRCAAFAGPVNVAKGSVRVPSGTLAVAEDAMGQVVDADQLGRAQSLVAAGKLTLVRDAAAAFRCPVLGNPQPIG